MLFEVGQKLQGKVTGITNFGAFVDIGSGKKGLVHISQISNDFVRDINEVLKVGDEVLVKVLEITEKEKISLSIKQATENTVFKKEATKQEEHSFSKMKSTGFKQGKETSSHQKSDFDSLMSVFLKDSDDRLLSLRRNTEGKRGGRGGRRT